MISNPFYLISLLTSSILAFITTALVIELILKFGRIKHFRISRFLRIMPFIFLFIDFAFNQTLSKWINPLSCKSCVQKFSLELFPRLKNHLYTNEISLISYLGVDYQHAAYSVIFILVVGLSLFFVIRKVISAYAFKISLHSILKNSSISDRSIESTKLLAEVQNIRL